MSLKSLCSKLGFLHSVILSGDLFIEETGVCSPLLLHGCLLTLSHLMFVLGICKVLVGPHLLLIVVSGGIVLFINAVVFFDFLNSF